MAGAAQLVAARGGAPVLPDERVVDRLAGRRVPGDHGLALVGDPDRVEARRPSMPASASACDGDPPGHLPDLVRRRARPSPGAGSAGSNSRVGAAGDRARRRRRRGRSSRSFPGRSRGSSRRRLYAGHRARRLHQTRAKSRSWRPRWRKPARVRPVARCSRSSSSSRDAVAGADGVDRHPDLHPVAAARTGSTVAQDLGPHRPLAGDRRRRLVAAAAADRPAGEAAARPRSRRRRGGESGDREVALAAPRPPRPAARSCAAEAPRSPSQSRTRSSSAGDVARAPPRRRRSRCRPCRAGGRG